MTNPIGLVNKVVVPTEEYIIILLHCDSDYFNDVTEAVKGES